MEELEVATFDSVKRDASIFVLTAKEIAEEKDITLDQAMKAIELAMMKYQSNIMRLSWRDMGRSR